MLLFGKPEDDSLLTQALRESAPQRCMLLFPGERAVSVDRFLDNICSGAPEPEPQGVDGVQSQTNCAFTVVVPDATWYNVKSMIKHFYASVDPHQMVPQVILQPPQPSVFRRAQRKLAKGKSLDRVCTTEAVAWLFLALGEPRQTCEQFIRTVEVRNAAVQGRRALQAWLDEHPTELEASKFSQGI